MIKKLKEILNKDTISLFSFLDSVGITNLTQKYYQNFYINTKKHLKITNVETLSKPIHLFAFMMGTPELYKSNDWYGHATILKKFAGYQNDYQIKAAIEHGADLSQPWNRDIDCPFRVLLTYGKNCYNYLHGVNKIVYTIGPLIQYAQSYLTPNQLSFEKNRLKKNLLVFPSHSTSVTDTSYDITALCNKLVTMKRDFNSIRICLYWKDVNNGIHHIYRKFGFECVTAGHIYDPLFLPRLKSIIETSTMTMSNNIGTHIGYCIYMNKPHYYFQQELSFTGNVAKEIDIIKTTEKSDSYESLRREFNTYKETISKQQYDIVNLYWGLDQIKTKEQLRQIFDEAERLYRK